MHVRTGWSIVALLTALAALLLPSAILAQTRPATTTASPHPLRVLFIGDAYTSANGGLDQVLQSLAKGKGRTIEAVASTSFGKSLAWHWESGSARALIAKGNWDFVVLQDPGPRDVPDREKLLGTLRSFDAEIRKVRAKPVVLATWGSAVLPEAQHALTEPIERLTEELDGKLAPLGFAAERATEEKPRMKFRAGDNNVPTPAGTYLAACVLYATLTGESANGLPASVKTAGRSFVLTADDAETCQRAADGAVGVVQAPAADAAAANTPAAGKSIVYILDATGTMLGLKFKLLLAQMSDALDQLGPDDRFNLIFFQGGDTDAEWMLPFSTRLERANDANKQKAREFMERHKVVGKGTNPLPALRLAFKQKPDLIWFLTDGEFNNVVGYDKVIAEVRKLNASKKTRLNTIAFMSEDPRAEEVLVTLAREQGGRFVKVSDKDALPTTEPARP